MAAGVASGPTLVLASASPRREALLRQAGLSGFRIVAPQIDETPLKSELPRAYALRMAREKCQAVAGAFAGEDVLVLAADTVVALGGRILPKAETDAEVEDCLKMLSGRRHQVMTALALAAPKGTPKTRIVATRVRFKRCTAQEIAAYVASGEGRGKAGGYAIQGRAEALIPSINGSYSSVVGLPLTDTLALLAGSGYRL